MMKQFLMKKKEKFLLLEQMIKNNYFWKNIKKALNLLLKKQ